MKLFRKKEKPVFREIFLSDENRKLRIILLCVFLGIAVVAIATGLMDFLSVDPGWQEVECLSDGVNCSQDFTLQYYFADSGAAATAVQKDLTNLYTEAAHKAYWMFTPDAADTENSNVYAINHSPNEAVTVDPVLYDAFALLQSYGSRNLYLGPVYQVYNNVFFSGDADQAAYWDPDRDADSAAYVAELMDFIRDEKAVSLKLLGENKVMLQVSDAYLAFAQENEIDTFIDFHWMTNAFIIDYFAQLMTQKGYTKGFIASYDGYTRNLNEGTDFSLNLFDKAGDTILPVGEMVYNKPISIVYLRSYPMSQQDGNRWFVYEDGSVTTSYVSPLDGMDQCASAQLVSYSYGSGCAQLLLEIAPVFIADSFDTQALQALVEEGVQSIWCSDAVICHTDAQLILKDLLQDENYSYSSALQP